MHTGIPGWNWLAHNQGLMVFYKLWCTGYILLHCRTQWTQCHMDYYAMQWMADYCHLRDMFLCILYRNSYRAYSIETTSPQSLITVRIYIAIHLALHVHPDGGTHPKFGVYQWHYSLIASWSSTVTLHSIMQLQEVSVSHLNGLYLQSSRFRVYVASTHYKSNRSPVTNQATGSWKLKL